jgi:hypothetical protein
MIRHERGVEVQRQVRRKRSSRDDGRQNAFGAVQHASTGAVGCGTPGKADEAVARLQSEEGDDCRTVVVRLNDHWRIIVCKAGIQWILQQKNRDAQKTTRWKGRSFCRTGEAIKRLARQHAGVINPAALAILDALPERIDAGASDIAEAAA